MIKPKTDGPKAAQKSHYTITKNGFVDQLNQDGAKLLQAENL